MLFEYNYFENLYDVVDVVWWVVKIGFDKGFDILCIFVGGDFVGGNFVVVMGIMCCDEGNFVIFG